MGDFPITETGESEPSNKGHRNGDQDGQAGSAKHIRTHSGETEQEGVPGHGTARITSGSCLRPGRNLRPMESNDRRLPRRPLLLYEGECPFCRAAARLVARIDRRQELALLPFDDPEAAGYSGGEDSEFRKHWHLIEPDGRDLIRGDAGVALLEHLAPLRKAGSLLRRFGLTPLVAAIDLVLDAARPYLSRVTPDGPAPRRPP